MIGYRTTNIWKVDSVGLSLCDACLLDIPISGSAVISYTPTSIWKVESVCLSLRDASLLAFPIRGHAVSVSKS